MFRKEWKMDLNYFKDKVFDLFNDTDTMVINDIDTNDKENTFKILLQDGNLFEVECRQVK